MKELCLPVGLAVLGLCVVVVWRLVSWRAQVAYYEQPAAPEHAPASAPPPRVELESLEWFEPFERALKVIDEKQAHRIIT